MKDRILNIINWLIVFWIAKVFLFSLPYKFTGHPDTLHIFGTIGQWMTGYLGDSTGGWFVQYGAYAVGSMELITSLILLSPLVFFLLKKAGIKANFPSQYLLHGLGGQVASAVMAGAVFFHLLTPLGIEVIHEGRSDNGSLFYAAVSIVILGEYLFFTNLYFWKSSRP